MACTALVIIVVLTAGHAFSQDKSAALDEAARKQEAVEARERAAVEKRQARRQIDEEISRRCIIRPVMTDAQIEGCRVAYRLL